MIKRPSTLEEWCTPGKMAVLLGLLVSAMFPEIILGKATFYYRDFGIYSYPLAHYQRECFWAGELPLWNPYNNCGIPFLAQWNTLALYPPALFYLLLPLSWALGMFCLLHLFWGGWGMYWLVRHWTQNTCAAAVAGIIFAFNGFTWHALGWTGISAALGWMPWVVWSVDRAWRQGGGWICAAALAGTFQMLTGAVELILFTWVINGALLFAGWPRGDGPRAVCRSWGRFALVVALVTGLAAAQVLPFLELLHHSQRGTGAVDAEWSMPGSGWANLFVPLFQCFPSFQGVFSQRGQFWTMSYYLGIGALFLAVWAAWNVRQRRVWILVALGVGSLILARGEHSRIYNELTLFFPAFGFMRFPVKFVMVLVFVIPVLAGYAIARIRSCQTSSLFRNGQLVLLIPFILAVGVIVWWAQAYPLQGDDWSATWRCGLVRIACLVAVAGSLWLLNAQRQPRTSLIAGISLVVTLWIDVRTHAPNLQPTVPLSVYDSGLLAREIQPASLPRHGQARVMMSAGALATMRHRSVGSPAEDYLGRRLGVFANCNLLDELPKVNGFFPLTLPYTETVTARLYQMEDGSDSPLGRFLGVAQVTAPENPTEWRHRAGALPLITAGQRPVFSSDNRALLEMATASFAPTQIVYLPVEEKAAFGGIQASSARIISAQYARHQMTAVVRAEKPAVVTIAQSAYPGWSARVDGAVVRLIRANVAFQALAIPAGEHHVEISYRDRAFHRGAMLSLGTFTLLFGVGMWRWARRRRFRGPVAKAVVRPELIGAFR